MLRSITKENVKGIKNEVFRSYEELYCAIQERFFAQVEEQGIAFDRDSRIPNETDALVKRLQNDGSIVFRNDGASVCRGNLSSACEACSTGEDTATFYISLKCHRSCYYCFNPNQEDYEVHAHTKRDWEGELKAAHRAGRRFRHIALTGGEPLLFPEDTLAFFKLAKELFDGVHTRLYTSGDLLDEAYLTKLKEAGLDEIRFSVKMEDEQTRRDLVLDRIAISCKYIEHVMVEMPVIPGTLEDMEDLLVVLDDLGVYSINLLEFCFPLNNAEAFLKRGFKIKFPPYRTYYNYWYAGGLPVAGSEFECLSLLEFASSRCIAMGVHYCSLENKNFGQIYQQNHGFVDKTRTLIFSPRDFFLKTMKAFGTDAKKVESILKTHGFKDYTVNEDYGYIQFHPRGVAYLKKDDLELGVSFQVAEYEGKENFLRELRVDATTAESFGIHDL